MTDYSREIDRMETLLRASYDLIRRSTHGPYVDETASILVRYDDADCDGYCLMEDIAGQLGLDDSTTNPNGIGAWGGRMTDYKGHDYTELFPALGIEWDNDDPESDIEAFKTRLDEMFVEASDHRIDSDQVLAIKMYLKAMAECGIDYWGPVWDGMIEVEDDVTFIQACIGLADHMWT